MDKKTFKRKVANLVKESKKHWKFLEKYADEILAVSKNDIDAFAAIAAKRGVEKKNVAKAFDLFKKVCVQRVSHEILLSKAVKIAGIG